MTPEDTTPQTMPEGQEPANRDKNHGRVVWLNTLAVILLFICIVGGVFLRTQSWQPSSSTVNNGSNGSTTNTLVWSKPWCASPASSSFTNFSGTSMSGLAENDVWSAGAQIMHWDGHIWKVAFKSSSPQDVFHTMMSGRLEELAAMVISSNHLSNIGMVTNGRLCKAPVKA